MKCPKCKHDAVEIRGKYFCPSCGEKIDLDYVRHELEQQMEVAKKRAKAFKNPSAPKAETDDVKVGLAAPPEEKPKNNPILDYFEEPEKEEKQEEQIKAKVPPQDDFTVPDSGNPASDNIKQDILPEEPKDSEVLKKSIFPEDPPVSQEPMPEANLSKPFADNSKKKGAQTPDVSNKFSAPPLSEDIKPEAAPKHVNDVMPPPKKVTDNFGDNNNVPKQNPKTEKKTNTPKDFKNTGMPFKLKLLLAIVVVLNILIIFGIIYLLVLSND